VKSKELANLYSDFNVAVQVVGEDLADTADRILQVCPTYAFEQPEPGRGLADLMGQAHTPIRWR
jgi:hypothetical protein